ncbi:ubiquinone biosynthesis monooxygenase Coq7 [Irineochytrium annulatum]|nr:ubiquinone biosynthesis monooxygenase Coq7 [Irineochytrium annulatum]
MHALRSLWPIRTLHPSRPHRFFASEPTSFPGEFQQPSPPSPPPPKQEKQGLTDKDRDMLASFLRVDHAGELGAEAIYRGQLAILGNDAKAGPVIQDMADQERKHKKVMDRLLAENRVRPTALAPVWEVAGLVLGAGTALMGAQAAMACTEAVEEVIGEHYNDQIRELIKLEADPEVAKLSEIIREFRDDELGHKEIATLNDAKSAPGYDPLVAVIKQGCRTAIWIASRI